MASVDVDFLVRHGSAVLLAVVLLEQLGLPLPVVPFLLAAGAFAGMGQLDPVAAFLAVLLACALSDAFWFELGRRRGIKVLRQLCRLSLEPDSCVRNTEDRFVRGGPNTLLLAKFLPGLNTVASPMAGMMGLGRVRFHLLAGAGALLWAGTWMSVGWIFRQQLDRAVQAATDVGVRVGLLLGLAFVAWLAYKWERRRRFLRSLRAARVAPLELKRLMDAGEAVVVVDLRGKLDFEADPVVIPGAMRLDPKELEERDPEIPSEREIVLYCT
jgi:membrane protein DedA with SNARE-associated domain